MSFRCYQSNSGLVVIQIQLRYFRWMVLFGNKRAKERERKREGAINFAYSICRSNIGSFLICSHNYEMWWTIESVAMRNMRIIKRFEWKMCCRENVVIVIGVKMFRKCEHGIMQMTLFECSNGRITRDHFQNGEV